MSQRLTYYVSTCIGRRLDPPCKRNITNGISRICDSLVEVSLHFQLGSVALCKEGGWGKPLSGELLPKWRMVPEELLTKALLVLPCSIG